MHGRSPWQRCAARLVPPDCPPRAAAAVLRRLLLGTVLAVLVLLPQLGDAVTAQYDTWTHLFFASHYVFDWFAPVDARWYLGLEVTRYPPLSHQVLALLTTPLVAAGVDLRVALVTVYKLVVAALTAALPLAVYQYGRELVDVRSAATGAVVAAVFSGWWMMLLGFGQYPTVFAVVVTLFGARALGVALRTRTRRHVALVTGLTATVPMIHHFSVISFLPAAYATVVGAYLWKEVDVRGRVRSALGTTGVRTRLVVLRRTGREVGEELWPAVVAGLAAVIVATSALFPFVEFLLFGPSQAPIPHGSRQSWLAGRVWTRPQFAVTLFAGSLLLGAIPLVLVVAWRRRSPGALIATGTATVTGVLAFGFTTPLPRLVYPGLAETLTYYRFAAWGGLLLLPALGLTVETLLRQHWLGWIVDRRRRIGGTTEGVPLVRVPSESPTGGRNGEARDARADGSPPSVGRESGSVPARSRGATIALALVGAILLSQVVVATGVASYGAQSPDRQAAAEEIGAFVEADERWRYRYLTLGMGQELGLVGIEAPRAATIDGNYNTGRSPERVPYLVRSGAGPLSNAKYSAPGRRALGFYLERHEQYHVRYVFSADRWYAETLRDNGYELLHEWPGSDVRVWHDPDVDPAYTDPPGPTRGSDPAMYVWGVVPLLTLLGTLACWAWVLWRPPTRG